MSLRDQLQAIYNQRGTLTPALVVETATDPDHPLHDRFEWDDRIAGPLYRLHQASHLLRVTYRPNPENDHDIRAFVAVRDKDTPQATYMPTEPALSDEIVARIVLRDMEREWRAFKRRYQNHAKFAAMIRADVQDIAS